MVTLIANIRSENLQYLREFPGLSVRLRSGIDFWRLPYKIWVGSGTFLASRESTQPIDEVRQTRNANRGKGFVDDYYYRIHVLPNVLALGSILGVQKRTVEVWNAFFDAHSFNSLTVNNPSGTELEPLGETAPTVLGALQSLRYTLTIGVAGPPTVDARYLFTFDTGPITLHVTGQRTAIFSFPPNWTEPVTERLSWLTQVLTSINGNEQRISRRLLPRRSYEFTVAQFQDNYQYLDALLVGWQNRIYAFPVWTDAQRLKQDAAQGTAEVTCETEGRDFYPGGYAIFHGGILRTEAVEILEVHPTRVVLTKTIDRRWPAGTVFAPSRLGRLQVEVEATRSTARLGEMRVAFDVDDLNSETPEPETTQFQGEELVLRKPNRAENVSVKYNRLQYRTDYDEGVISVVDKAQRSFSTRSGEYLLPDRLSIAKFKRWLFARQGQLKPFWTPVWECNIDVVGPTNAVDTSLTVRAQGFSSLLSVDGSRKNIAIKHKSGQWFYRQVLQYGAGLTEDTEIVYINEALGIATLPGDIVFVTFLDYVVLNADDIEISYLKSDAATTRIATRSINQ